MFAAFLRGDIETTEETGVEQSVSDLLSLRRDHPGRDDHPRLQTAAEIHR